MQSSKSAGAFLNHMFDRIAGVASNASGSTAGFILALGAVILWGVAGPFFKFSEKWQLIITSGTSIITFLMVFLIQKAQNKDFLALQIKLNELVSAHKTANNQIINIEDLTEQELQVLNKYYSRLAEKARNAEDKGSLDGV